MSVRVLPDMVPKFNRHQHRGEGFLTWRSNFLNTIALLTIGLNRTQAESVMLSALRLASADPTFNDIVKFSVSVETALARLEATFGLSREQRELRFWESVSSFGVKPGETLKELCMRTIGIVQNATELGIPMSLSQFKHLIKRVLPLHTLEFAMSRIAGMENMDTAIQMLEDLANRYGDYTFRNKTFRSSRNFKHESHGPMERRKDYASKPKTDKPAKPVKEEVKRAPKCYACGELGHISPNCPNKNQVNNTLPSDARMYPFIVDTGAFTNVFGKHLEPFCKKSGRTMNVSVPFGSTETVETATLSVKPPGSDVSVNLEGIIDTNRDVSLLRPDSIHWKVGSSGTTYVKGVPFPIGKTNVYPPVTKVCLNIAPTKKDPKKEEEEILTSFERVFYCQANPEENLSVTNMVSVFHHRLAHPGIDRTLATLNSVGVRVTRKHVADAITQCEHCTVKDPITHSVNALNDQDPASDADELELAQRMDLPPEDTESSEDEVTEIEARPVNEDCLPMPYKRTKLDLSESLMLHSDVGFMRESDLGNKYISVIKEKETGCLWVRPLQSTSEARTHIIDTINWLARTVKSKPVASLQTDNGTEYVNSTLVEWLSERGISHFTNPKRSKESNGTAERAVREAKKLINVVRSMFQLRPKNWDWTVDTVSYVHNLTCAFNALEPPIVKLLQDKKPDYRFLPTRPIVVAEEDMESSKKQNTPVKAVYMGHHYNNVLFDYLVDDENGYWTWKEEHPRFINLHREVINRMTVESSKTPICATTDPEPSVPTLTTTTQDLIANVQYSGVDKETAMKKELDGFIKHQVFCEKYEDAPVIPSMWLFSVKSDGTHKGRLVVLGNLHQSRGETATSPPSVEMLMTYLSYLACSNVQCIQVDISTAFLHADIDERVNIRLPKLLPEGFQYRGVVGLKKAVYGLAQSPRLFEKHLETALTKLGFAKIQAGLFTRDQCILFAYVDDLLIAGSQANEVLEEIRHCLDVGKSFPFNCGDAITFLGVRIRREPYKITVSLQEYAKEYETPGIRGSITASSMKCNEDMEADWALTKEVQKYLGVLGWIARFYPKASVYHSMLASSATRHPCKKILSSIQRVVNLYTSFAQERMLEGSASVDLVMMSDASHSLITMEARVGTVIGMLVNPNDLHSLTPILTRTKKVKRKIKSAFEAELEGVLLLSEEYEKHQHVLKILPINNIRVISDSQSLVAAYSSGKTQDPFSSPRLELLIQRLHDQGLKLEWQPRKYQAADGLTKINT